jgi:hypothetical protein
LSVKVTVFWDVALCSLMNVRVLSEIADRKIQSVNFLICNFHFACCSNQNYLGNFFSDMVSALYTE